MFLPVPILWHLLPQYFPQVLKQAYLIMTESFFLHCHGVPGDSQVYSIVNRLIVKIQIIAFCPGLATTVLIKFHPLATYYLRWYQSILMSSSHLKLCPFSELSVIVEAYCDSYKRLLCWDANYHAASDTFQLLDTCNASISNLM